MVFTISVRIKIEGEGEEGRKKKGKLVAAMRKQCLSGTCLRRRVSICMQPQKAVAAFDGATLQLDMQMHCCRELNQHTMQSWKPQPPNATSEVEK